MRIDKYICKSTELTRSEAKSILKRGDVRVNDVVIKNPSTQVHENNNITVNGQCLTARTSRYIMMHKAVDTICSNVNENHPSVLNFIDVDKAFDLHIAGRLDVDTTGLLLITDDGRWSHRIISPKSNCNKIYRVWLRYPLKDGVIEQFATGVQLQGESDLTLPSILSIVYNAQPSDPTINRAPANEKNTEVLLTLTEGKYHQVKRMFAAVGNKVIQLHRERIGDITLSQDLAVGEWRYLTETEVSSVT
jgi:16S rRNA pseudouridine516 synthase